MTVGQTGIMTREGIADDLINIPDEPRALLARAEAAVSLAGEKRSST